MTWSSAVPRLSVYAVVVALSIVGGIPSTLIHSALGNAVTGVRVFSTALGNRVPLSSQVMLGLSVNLLLNAICSISNRELSPTGVLSPSWTI